MPSINLIAFDTWVGALQAPCAGPRPSTVRTSVVVADYVAGYGVVAACAALVSPGASYSCVLPGGSTAVGVRVASMVPSVVRQARGSALVVIDWVLVWG